MINYRLLKGFFSFIVFVLLGYSKPVLSADRVVLSVPILGEFTVSRESLEQFAKDGTVSHELGLYTRYLNQEELDIFREFLQQRVDMNPVVISRFTQVGMGETLLKRMGELIQMEGNISGFYGLRSALVLSAFESEGVSILSVIRHFPRQEVRLNLSSLLGLWQEFTTLSDYTETSVRAIAQQANLEAQTETWTNLEQLKDLRKIGQYNHKKQTFTFNIQQIRQTNQGLSALYPLEVDFYLPIDAPTPAPLIIISHGFGSYQGNYGIAEHLASYGFAVAVPRHIGSDLAYRESFLRGELRVILSPIEFVSRPQDITNLLDELEKLAKTETEWVKQINLDKVGIIGHSLGGSTALSLAGANINLERLKQDCEEKNQLLNFSLLLQCRGVYLPPNQYQLKDPRIKAITLAHPLDSSIFGPEELKKIEIPTLIIAGSKDIVTPVMIEQVHPFIWLETPDKYLSLMNPGTHFSSTLQPDTEGVEGLPEFLRGNNADLGTPYFKGVSVAFFEVYLHENSTYLPYLSASYGQLISEERLEINMIQSLTSNQLEQAYQQTPPVAIYPPTVAKKGTSNASGTILEEIEKTGVLKVALRGDAPPFGYINQQGEWTGYCEDWVIAFKDYLQKEYNISSKIEVIQLPSNLDNRFSLVRENQAYLECGPNTIQDNIPDITFSKYFFLTGTQFLINPKNDKVVNPFQSLTNVRVGVSDNTTTQDFIQRQYPDAKIETYNPTLGKTEGIQEVQGLNIDTFASDGILLIGEIERQGLSPDSYQIVPDIPLTCEYYGMILPQKDEQWKTIVNQFLETSVADVIWLKWFASHSSHLFKEVNDCINR